MEMRICVGNQLVGTFRRAVKRDHPIDRIVDRERHFRVGAIDRRGAGIDEMLQPVAEPRILQHDDLAQDVGLDILVWVLQGISYAGLRGEVNDMRNVGDLISEGENRVAV